MLLPEQARMVTETLDVAEAGGVCVETYKVMILCNCG
jgi:hypothetical protein